MAGQLWSVNSLGGFLANPTLSRKIRHAAQPLMKFKKKELRLKETLGQ